MESEEFTLDDELELLGLLEASGIIGVEVESTKPGLELALDDELIAFELFDALVPD